MIARLISDSERGLGSSATPPESDVKNRERGDEDPERECHATQPETFAFDDRA